MLDGLPEDGTLDDGTSDRLAEGTELVGLLFGKLVGLSVGEEVGA
jgi:hypothetical protein